MRPSFSFLLCVCVCVTGRVRVTVLPKLLFLKKHGLISGTDHHALLVLLMQLSWLNYLLGRGTYTLTHRDQVLFQLATVQSTVDLQGHNTSWSRLAVLADPLNLHWKGSTRTEREEKGHKVAVIKEQTTEFLWRVKVRQSIFYSDCFILNYYALTGRYRVIAGFTNPVILSLLCRQWPISGMHEEYCLILRRNTGIYHEDIKSTKTFNLYERWELNGRSSGGED